MDPLQPGHYWKTPFYWESGCPQPPLERSLFFEPVSDDALRPLIGAVMATSMDESDRFTVPRVGIEAAVQEVYDLLPRYFERQPGWWRMAKDSQGQPVGFVLPVTFKEERHWKDGRPQGRVYRAQAVAAATGVVLKEINPDYLIPMHCSGEPFIAIAMQEIPGKVLRSSTGTRFIFAGGRSRGVAKRAAG